MTYRARCEKPANHSPAWYDVGTKNLVRGVDDGADVADQITA